MGKNGISYPRNVNKLVDDFSVSKDELCSHFLLADKIKADNKLKELQYRIITSIYNTNVLLEKKKLSKTAICDFCSIERQNLYHLFYDCSIISKFWHELELYWKNKTKNQISLTRKDVILGNTQFSDLLNLVLLLAKCYIHKSKISNVKPKLEMLVATLRDKYFMEKTCLYRECSRSSR